MIKEIVLLNEEREIILGTSDSICKFELPLEGIDNKKVLITQKIHKIFIALVMDAFSYSDSEILKQITKHLPCDITEKEVRRNYFKYLFLLESLKIKFDSNENNQIIPLDHVFKIKESLKFGRNELFIDVYEEYNAILDIKLEVYSCSIIGSIICKSNINKMTDLKIYFKEEENTDFFGNSNITQDNGEKFFALRTGSGKIKLSQYVIHDIMPPIFIKKVLEGYELISKSFVSNLIIHIPIPLSAYNIEMTTKYGTLKENLGYITWKIHKLTDSNVLLFLKYSTVDKEEVVDPIKVYFTNKSTKGNHLKILSVKASEGKIVSYAKYEYSTDNYEIRIDN